MKRLLVVLFGVLVFQASVWAECPDAKVLSPGENSVLIKDLPFVLQWQDDDLCLGREVKIDLIDDNDKHIAYEEGKRVDYKVKRTNSGFLIINQFKAPPSHQKYHFKISPTQKSKRADTIESKPFSVITSKVKHASGERAEVFDKSKEYYLYRDLLARITALEGNTGRDLAAQIELVAEYTLGALTDIRGLIKTLEENTARDLLARITDL